jgi:very-long-chain ceramide synthase
MLYSVQTEFDLIPKESRQWNPPHGAWLAWWMKYQVLIPIAALHVINLFWYYLIMRILYR